MQSLLRCNTGNKMEKQRKKIWQENFLTKFLKLLLQWNTFVVETLLDEAKPFILNWKVI